MITKLFVQKYLTFLIRCGCKNINYSILVILFSYHIYPRNFNCYLFEVVYHSSTTTTLDIIQIYQCQFQYKKEKEARIIFFSFYFSFSLLLLTKFSSTFQFYCMQIYSKRTFNLENGTSLRSQPELLQFPTSNKIQIEVIVTPSSLNSLI